MNEEIFEQLKNEVIIESNRNRRNSKAYITILEEYLKNFDGNILARPDKEECLETQEGQEPIKKL